MASGAEDNKIKNVGDLIRALDTALIRDVPIRGVMLAQHPDGKPRRLVVSFEEYKPPISPEL